MAKALAQSLTGERGRDREIIQLPGRNIDPKMAVVPPLVNIDPKMAVVPPERGTVLMIKPPGDAGQ